MDIVKAIETLGGLSAAARALGMKSVSTVQYWRDTKRLPAWRVESVERALKAAAKSKPRKRSAA